MTKEERQERWTRRKSHKTRQGKNGFLSGNARYNRHAVNDVNVGSEDEPLVIHPKDQRMGRASEAA